jgi:hypothetical protein
VQAGHPIDRNSYFREKLFGDAEWNHVAGKEVADLDCEVVIGGTAYGAKRLRIVHDPAFESNQNNRTTLLRWGELQTYMQANDHTGDIVTIERLSDGSCRIAIGPTETGPFLP